MDISILIGKTLVKVERGVASYDCDNDAILFYVSPNEVYEMSHQQSCCETVSIDDICGEFEWLIGSPILVAEERTNSDEPDDEDCPDESYTWTFYELATIKGSVTIRWYGSSNGYYSESVDFMLIRSNKN